MTHPRRNASAHGLQYAHLTLQNFIAAFSAGYSRLQGPINSLLGILVGVEIVLLGLWSALGGGDNVVGVFKKILHIGFWVWLVKGFPDLAKAFVESLIDAGLMAGGGGLGSDVSVIMDPSRIAGYGLDATEPLTKKIQDLGAFDMADLIVFGIGYLAIMGCFVVMAINIFIAVRVLPLCRLRRDSLAVWPGVRDEVSC